MRPDIGEEQAIDMVMKDFETTFLQPEFRQTNLVQYFQVSTIEIIEETHSLRMKIGPTNEFTQIKPPLTLVENGLVWAMFSKEGSLIDSPITKLVGKH